MALSFPFHPSTSGEWQFDLEGWKRGSFGIDWTRSIHSMATKWLRYYFENKAQAEIECLEAVNAPPTQSETESNQSDAIAGSADSRPAQLGAKPKPTAAQLAEEDLTLTHWELTFYSWSLENLVRDLRPALARSCWFSVIWGTAKLVQLRFWPTAGHAFAGLLLKTLAAYHVGFVLTYLSSLYVVFLSMRGAEKLKQKISDRTITEDDLRAWGGLPFSAANLIADMRYYQGFISNPQRSPGPWYVDMVLSWLWL